MAPKALLRVVAVRELTLGLDRVQFAHRAPRVVLREVAGRTCQAKPAEDQASRHLAHLDSVQLHPHPPMWVNPQEEGGIPCQLQRLP